LVQICFDFKQFKQILIILDMEQEAKKKKPGKVIIVAVVLIVILGIGIFYWIRSKSFETTDNAQLDCNIVPIRSVVTAYLKSINFNDNDHVKKGQVLFIFDTTEIKAKMEEAEAALEIAGAKLLSTQNKASASNESAEAGILTTESYKQSILSAKANLDKAQSIFNRTAALLKIKAATQEQYETAEAALSVAKADYVKAINVQKSSSSTSMGLKSMAKSDENQINMAEAQVEQYKRNVSWNMPLFVLPAMELFRKGLCRKVNIFLLVRVYVPLSKIKIFG
jgi:membrane fusion protein (multidrug efflux system)